LETFIGMTSKKPIAAKERCSDEQTDQKEIH